MSSSREAILARVRKATAGQASERGELEARLRQPKHNTLPKRGQVPARDRLDLFKAQAEAVNATVALLASEDDIPEASATYLKQHNLPNRLRLAPSPSLEGLSWSEKAPLIELSAGPSDGSDEVSLVPAVGAVAETGTLILTSDPERPITLNFLPETHLVTVKASEIVATYEEVWQGLRERYGSGSMPRTVNMVTGPSRTGDIEQKIQLGAHGPRRLHILIVDDL